MKRVAIAVLIALVSGGALHAAGYKDDNVRWLVYDMKTKDKTLMDIRMDTYMKGTATFTGPLNRIGRRSAPMRQGSRNYIVTMRRGVINVLDNAGAPIMWGEIDLDRGEIKGEFTEQYGGGSWVASEKGPSGTRMDLFQYCGDDGYDSPEDWSCQNVGQGEQCFYGWTGEAVGSFNLDACVETAKRHCLKVAAEEDSVTKLLRETYWDETAQKCETE
jgi:hypothetical protein